MALLTESTAFGHILWVVFGLGLVFFTLSLGLIVSSLVRAAWSQYGSRNLVADEERTLQFLYGDPTKPLSVAQFTPTTPLRDHLIDLARNISGDEKLKLAHMYDQLGFLIEDVKKLRFGSTRTRSTALARLRTLAIDLPDDGWQYLTHRGNLVFRWAAYEYLIHKKGAFAVFWLMNYLNHNKEVHNGIRQHLLSCLAAKYPESMLTILQYTDDPDLEESCLRTLAHYPQAAAVDLVASKLSSTNSDEAYIAAIKALGATPGEKILPILEVACDHPHWVVRLEVAKALHHYTEPAALLLVHALTSDFNYHVRLRAVETALNHGPSAQNIIREIAQDSEHPSANILSYLRDIRGAA